MLGLCRVLLRQREEAEDAVQQTFLSAYRSLLNGVEPRNPAGWLATIARNECWGRIQQRTREPLSEPDPEGTLPSPVAAAAERADLAALWQAIGELPRQQREALLLREFSGLSYIELAAALGVSKPAVESLLFRARRGLRVRLQPVYGSAAGVAPLAGIREALSRHVDGFTDASRLGPLAKIASAPLLAKLAVGTAAVVVAGGTVVAVNHEVSGHHVERTPHASILPLNVTPDLTPARTAARTLAHEAATSVERARHVLSRVVRSITGSAPAATVPSSDAQNPGSDNVATTTSASSSDNSSGDEPATTTTTPAADTSGDTGSTTPSGSDSSGDTTSTTPSSSDGSGDTATTTTNESDTSTDPSQITASGGSGDG